MKKEYILEVDGICVQVIRKQNKNMYLRVKEPEGQVVATVPMQMKDEAVWKFVMEHAAWIREAVSKVKMKEEQQEQLPVEAPFVERENRYRLKRELTLLIDKWEPVMQVQANGFTIRKMKTRWGSCNVQSHHLNFNYALTKVPKECLEYVVVHELTHLLEPSHNERFWRLMEYYLPGAKQLRKRLNTYQTC